MSKRKKYSPVWDFFTQYDLNDKVAVCNICSKHLSYRTTSNNLKSHLKGKHPYRYTQLMGYSPKNGLLKMQEGKRYKKFNSECFYNLLHLRFTEAMLFACIISTYLK